jgi:azurin
MIRKLSYLSFVAVIAVAFAACGPTDRPAETNGTADADEDGVRVVTIRPVGNEMRYEQTEFTVQPGQEVRIVFENTATSEAMHHNVVVIEDRESIDRVGNAALEAGAEADYIPEDDAIIAYTAMAAPGETVEVTFTAPDTAGDYPYICTYPGHYMLMQGTMRVAQ